ncbi:MAG: hypothetical protein ACJA2R_000067 [Saprospiraceae bacterium]|jgi:hypothetical protein
MGKNKSIKAAADILKNINNPYQLPLNLGARIYFYHEIMKYF